MTPTFVMRAARVRQQRHVEAEADRAAERWRREVQREFEMLRIEASLAAIRAGLDAGQAEQVVRAAVPGDVLARLTPAMLFAGIEAGRRNAIQNVPAAAREVAEELAGARPASVRAVVWAERHAAERVTQVTEATRQAIREAVVRQLATGAHVQAGATEVRDIIGLHSNQAASLDRQRAALRKAGVSGERLDKRVEKIRAAMIRTRAETIARSETFTAVNRGRADLWQELVDAGQVEPLTMTRVWMTAQDERVDDICWDLEGQTVSLQESFSSSIGAVFEPPAHVNCLLPGTEVRGRFVAGLQAWYSGEAVELRTHRGYRLAVTPNHPVATMDGFAPAGSLRKGMHLLSDARNVDAASLGGVAHHDKYQGPVCVEDVLGALRERGVSCRAAAAALNLHGDARFVEGEIEVVAAVRILLRHGEAQRAKRGGKLGFVSPEMQETGVSSFRTLQLFGERMGSPPRGLPGGGTLPFDTMAVRLQFGPLEPLGVGASADWDAGPRKAAQQDRAADAAFVRELLERSPIPVALDEIVEIRHFNFAGHVRDLQSTTGWMIAGGIAISNCRCTVAIEGKQ